MNNDLKKKKKKKKKDNKNIQKTVCKFRHLEW